MSCPDHPADRSGRALSALLCIALALLLTLSFVHADSEGAYSGDWGDVQWDFDGIKLTFTMPDNAQTSTATVYMPNVPNDAIRQDVQTIEFNGPVTVRQEGFTNCPKLEQVCFNNIDPNGLKAARAFQGCTALVSVGIGTECKIIGDGCFYGCTSLKNIYPVDSVWKVTVIGSQAFFGCTKLETQSVIDLFNKHPRYYEDATYHSYWMDNLQEIGESAFEGCTALTDVTLPQFIDFVGKYAFKDCKNITGVVFKNEETFSIGDVMQYNGANSIGAGAFYGCTKLESVTLPVTLCSFEKKSKTEIGEGVFENCPALSRIELPENLSGPLYNTFKNCTSLSKITIPAGVTELYYTFYGCKNLCEVTLQGTNLKRIDNGFYDCSFTQIQIPASVTDLNYAFRDCTGLTSVTVPGDVTNMHMAFSGCTGLETVTLPSSVINLDHAFDGCKSLQDISIPSSVTELSYAFNGCSALRSVEIPEGFTGGVGSNQTSSTTSAFYNCTSLTNVSLPDSLQKIGVSTFEGCTALTEITIPANVTAIGGSAFRGCTKLGRVNFAARAESAEGGNAPEMTIGSQAFKNCSSLTAFSFPKGLKKIEANAFENTALQTADLSAVVTGEAIISTYAFSNCKSLKTAVIGNGFKVIDYRAFEGCSNLEALTLGEGVKRIGERAFFGTKLTDVTFPAGLEQIGQYAMPTLRYARFRGRGACPTFQNCAFWYSPSSVTVQCFRVSAIEAWVRAAGFNIEYWGTSLELPGSLQRVEAKAFIGIAVESIVVPKDVTYIGHQAFSNLHAKGGVTVVIKADSVTIEKDAFQGSTVPVLIQAPAGFAYSADDFDGATVTIKIQ